MSLAAGPQMSAATSTAQWAAVQCHVPQMRDLHLRALFASDPERGRELAVQAGDLYVDYVKHRVTRETLSLLLDLADAADLRGRIDAMFSGEHINITEDPAPGRRAHVHPLRPRPASRRCARRQKSSDPRVSGAAAEDGMSAWLVQACAQLRSAGTHT